MDALKFKESALNKWKFWLGMWKDLPSVAFWGIKVKDLNDTSCVVVVPFNYRSKNPLDKAIMDRLAKIIIQRKKRLL